MPKSSSRPPLDDRAREVLRLARLEAKLARRVKSAREAEAALGVELRTTRKLLRDLMADAGTFGPDGQNQGELPC
jgi:hypothetical protein